MNERGRLKRLSRRRKWQFSRRQLAQLIVDQRQELTGRRAVAVFDRGKDDGDIGHRVTWQNPLRLGPDTLMMCDDIVGEFGLANKSGPILPAFARPALGLGR
jgi:hypothetical protein